MRSKGDSQGSDDAVVGTVAIVEQGPEAVHKPMVPRPATTEMPRSNSKDVPFDIVRTTWAASGALSGPLRNARSTTPIPCRRDKRYAGAHVQAIDGGDGVGLAVVGDAVSVAIPSCTCR